MKKVQSSKSINTKTTEEKKMNKNKETITMKDVLDIISPLPKTYTKDSVIVVVDTKLGKKKMNINSEDFKNYLSLIIFDEYDIYPSKTIICDAINYIMATRFDYVSDNACYRIKSENNHIYYDLNNNSLGYIDITPNGWSVKNNSNNYFLTSPFAVEQVTPKEGNIDILRKYINLSDDDWVLFKVYLISCFNSNILQPIINFVGDKGTCKSTISEILKRLIDPSQQNLGEFSTKLDDFRLRLSSEYFVVADNLQKITKAISDLLCRLVTGGNMTRRKLYTDNEQIMDKYIARLAINSINPVVLREDLIDRTVFLTPLSISSEDRIPIDHFWTEFEKDKPYILGGIFTILSKALKIYPDIKLNNYMRLADFHKFGYAVAMIMGEGEKFNRLLIQNRQKYLLSQYEGNSILKLLIAFMDNNNGYWKGRMNKLLTELQYLVEDKECNDLSDVEVPDSVESLGRLITFRTDTLSSVFGIFIKRYKDTDGYRCIRLERPSINEDIKVCKNEVQRKPIFRLPIIFGEGKL